MKFSSLVLSTALAVFTLTTGSLASAAGAASWNCISYNSGTLATYDVSMFSEILTVLQMRKDRPPLIWTYFVDETARPAPGSKIFLQDDPEQDGLQQKVETFPSELMEITLPEGEGHLFDLAFMFQGENFYCSRN